ncbi:MAG TPA: VWA domain-containing protein, partial [Phycisphaerae bacterium]
GTAEQLKRDLTAEVCATLAFSAIKNNDKVGLILFTDRIEKFVPARKGPRHVLRVIRDLLYHDPQGHGTDIAAAFDHLNKVTTRRCVVFLVSDFQAVGYEQPLRIARKRHDLIPICIHDPRESVLPNVGLIELMDAETGELLVVDSASRHVRAQFADEALTTRTQREWLLRRMKVDSINVMTGQSFVEPLTRFFRAREARM